MIKPKTVVRILYIPFIIFVFVNPPICFMIMGLILIYIALNTFIKLQDLKKFGINCEGAIVEYVTNKYGDRTPIIKFNTSKGIEISGKPFGTYSGVIGPFRFSNDPTTEKLAIRYNSKNPEQFIYKGQENINYFLFLIVTLIGILLITLCFLELAGEINWFNSNLLDRFEM